MRVGGSLFIIHHPEATLTGMFLMPEMYAKSLIWPWCMQTVIKGIHLLADYHCNTILFVPK